MSDINLNHFKDVFSDTFHADLNVLRDVILFFAKVDSYLSPTRLVKLIYLAELEHIKRVSEPLTGAFFISDHYGPNSKEIQVLTELMDGEELEILEEIASTDRFMKHIRLKCDLPELQFNPEQIITLKAIFHKWGHKSNEAIISATKETKPYLATPFKERIYLDAQDSEQRVFFVEQERILRTEESYPLE